MRRKRGAAEGVPAAQQAIVPDQQPRLNVHGHLADEGHEDGVVAVQRLIELAVALPARSSARTRGNANSGNGVAASTFAWASSKRQVERSQ